MSSQPYDQEAHFHVEDRLEEDGEIRFFVFGPDEQEVDGPYSSFATAARIAHEFNQPLEEAVWKWRERFDLVTIEDVVERLAQELQLYIVLST